MSNLLQDPGILRNWRQPSRLTVSEWADRYRKLDPLFSNGGGSWRTRDVPYLREIMDSATTPWVRKITLCGSTQIGKTEAANNVLGYHVHQKPSPSMVVMPRNSDVKTAAKRRIRPMVAASPALMEEMTGNKHDYGLRDIAFRRSILYLRSAQSPADMAGVPVRLVLGDETEKWPEWSGNEASPLALVTERTRIFPDSLVMLTSTPRVRGGIILREFERGDQRRYHVPCPQCKKLQAFRWTQVQWPDRIKTAEEMNSAKSAWYRCEYCGHCLDDADKRTATQNGIWVPKGWTPQDWMREGAAADRTEHRSYHLWAAYSPWLTWWRIAERFLASKDDAAELMNFTNSWLAEPWEDRVADITNDAVSACIDARLLSGEVPPLVRVITAAVDVQSDRLEWMVRGWGLDEESWLLGAGVATDWESLADALFRRKWGRHSIRLCVVDSRFRRDEVVEFCRRHHPVTRLIAGVEREMPIPFQVVKHDRHPKTGAPIPGGLTIWTIAVEHFKDLEASRIARAVSAPEDRVGRIHIPADMPHEWLKQLGSEHKVRERAKGRRTRMRWVLKPGAVRNEAWDLLVYTSAAARMIRVDALRSQERMPDAVMRRRRRP